MSKIEGSCLHIADAVFLVRANADQSEIRKGCLVLVYKEGSISLKKAGKYLTMILYGKNYQRIKRKTEYQEQFKQSESFDKG